MKAKLEDIPVQNRGVELESETEEEKAILGISLSNVQHSSSPTEGVRRVEMGIEPTNLCQTCQKQSGCFKKGIFEREACDEYKPWPLKDLLERDKFVRGVMVGACPRCGSENTYDCENNPLLEDNTVGHCLDCETYWCLECGYVFKAMEKGATCPHWDICGSCSKEHGESNA